MTRNETIEIFQTNSNYTKGAASFLIDGLAALGLIKFDDVERVKRVWYQSENSDIWGTVRISEYDGELHLWIAGRHRFALKKENV